MRIFRKYYYLKLYDGNQVRQNFGYIRIESGNGKTKCSFYIMNLSSKLSGVAEVYVETNDERRKIGNIFIRQGKCREMFYLNASYSDGDIQVIEIPIHDALKIGYRIEAAGNYKKNLQEDRKLNSPSWQREDQREEQKVKQQENSSNWQRAAQKEEQKVMQQESSSNWQREGQREEQKEVQQEEKKETQWENRQSLLRENQQGQQLREFMWEEDKANERADRDQVKEDNIVEKTGQTEEQIEEQIEEQMDRSGEAQAVSIEEPENVEPYFAPDTKWEQLKKTYPNIHIFEESAEVLLIKPQDLVVLTEKYQSLISNSFLLHGYYNYRQLLLLKWKKDEDKYYVGVPGNFLDREKNVAIMFGFESFENGEGSRRNQVTGSYPGNFGYYLKEVEI